ncbi:MAG: polysaccharide lyase 6 family protein [Paludibacteraceae bacterium]|nr:polysaccharide lyase 6 family protein [Paludibacteraceae bacterium]
MKKALFIVLLASLPLVGVLANIVSVSGSSAIGAQTWQPGDTLVMTDGTWTGQSITLKGNGTAQHPVVMMAQHAGQVLLKGSSSVTVSGQYVEVNGLVFEGASGTAKHAIRFQSGTQHCRLTECVMRSFSPSDPATDTKWVSLYGQNNRVDHCLFEGKSNIGTLLVVWLEQGIVPAHQIDHNHFGYRHPNLDEDGKELNGQEIIRIGDSNTSMQDANCVVEYNFFDQCDGEIETISNKSCGNIYRHNTLYECAGMLTLRHGNNCTVDSNYFIGNHKSATGGVRIIGEGHTVTDNYFENLAGNNYRAGICIVRGKVNSKLNEYFQVKGATVTGNIFVNCREAFCVNYNSSSSCTLPPISTTIDANFIYMSGTGKMVDFTVKQQEDMDITWGTNPVNQGSAPTVTPEASADNTGPLWLHSATPTGVSCLPHNQSRNTIKLFRHGTIVVLCNGAIYTMPGNKM